MNAACQQWDGKECGLIDRLLAEYERQFGAPADDELPDCPIRSECRWFLQRGGRSCAVCEVLVTDVELTEKARRWAASPDRFWRRAALAAGRPAEAERVYREDLARFPENGIGAHRLSHR